MIKLGISSCFLYPDINRKYFGPKTLCYLENDMAKYLGQNNVLPVLIPDFDGKQMESLLDKLDGLVLQGGSDLSPESYTEEFLNKEKWPGDRYRDLYEFSVLDYFVKKKKPVFGICRGAQVLNVYFGGTLYQDIPSQVDTSIKHRDAVEYDNVCHEIEFRENSFLNNIYKEKQPMVNSVHHQGIKDLATDLVVEATSSKDGIIEAISYKNKTDHFIFGVQWHPEFSQTLGEKVLDPKPLLNYFLERC